MNRINWHDHFFLIDSKLYWKRGNNQVKSGDQAGWVMNGYIYSEIFGYCYPHHSIIWEMRNGDIPDGFEIDHVNHVRDDNSPENHRLVTHRDNCRNFSISKRNTSGVCGVVWRKDREMWLAQIEISDKGKRRNIKLGTSKDWFEAVCLRMSANIRYGFHQNHGK